MDFYLRFFIACTRREIVGSRRSNQFKGFLHVLVSAESEIICRHSTGERILSKLPENDSRPVPGAGSDDPVVVECDVVITA